MYRDLHHINAVPQAPRNYAELLISTTPQSGKRSPGRPGSHKSGPGHGRPPTRNNNSAPANCRPSLTILKTAATSPLGHVFTGAPSSKRLTGRGTYVPLTSRSRRAVLITSKNLTKPDQPCSTAAPGLVSDSTARAVAEFCISLSEYDLSPDSLVALSYQAAHASLQPAARPARM